MDYIIRSFDKEKGQITVEYAGKWTYAIDLVVENGLLPTGEKLEAAIQAMAPVWLLEREVSLANLAEENAAQIMALVQPYPQEASTQPDTLPSVAVMPPLTEGSIESDIAFIKEVVNEVLAEKGL